MSASGRNMESLQSCEGNEFEELLKNIYVESFENKTERSILCRKETQIGSGKTVELLQILGNAKEQYEITIGIEQIQNPITQSSEDIQGSGYINFGSPSCTDTPITEQDLKKSTETKAYDLKKDFCYDYLKGNSFPITNAWEGGKPPTSQAASPFAPTENNKASTSITDENSCSGTQCSAQDLEVISRAKWNAENNLDLIRTAELESNQNSNDGSDSKSFNDSSENSDVDYSTSKVPTALNLFSINSSVHHAFGNFMEEFQGFPEERQLSNEERKSLDKSPTFEKIRCNILRITEDEFKSKDSWSDSYDDALKEGYRYKSETSNIENKNTAESPSNDYDKVNSFRLMDEKLSSFVNEGESCDLQEWHTSASKQFTESNESRLNVNVSEENVLIYFDTTSSQHTSETTENSIETLNVGIESNIPNTD